MARPRAAGRPVVGMCVGKDCRRTDGFAKVQRQLASACEVLELKCLDVCDGVVVVVDPRGPDSIVIERVRKPSMASEIADHAVYGAPLSRRLRKHELTGSARVKARRRIERAT